METYEARKSRATLCLVSAMEISLPTVSALAEVNALDSVDSLSGTATEIPSRELAGVNVTMKNTTIYCNGSSCISTEDAIGSAVWKNTLPALSNSNDYAIVANSIDRAGNGLVKALNSLVQDTVYYLKIHEAAHFDSLNGTRRYQPPLLADNIPTGMKLEGAPPRQSGWGLPIKHICSSMRKGEMNKCAIA